MVQQINWVQDFERDWLDKSELRDQQIPTCLYKETFSSCVQITRATIF